MAAVYGVIPNVIGGVSQQPPEIRALNTSTAMSNGWDSPATGKSTRPNQDFMGNFSFSVSAGKTVAFHTIDDGTNQYAVTVHNGVCRVMDLSDGSLETVTPTANATSYITTNDAAANIGFLTIGDTTFIWNRATTTAKTATSEGTGLTGSTEDSVVRKNPNRHSTVWIKQTLGRITWNALYLNNVKFVQDKVAAADDAITATDNLETDVNTFTAVVGGEGSYYTNGVEGPLTTNRIANTVFNIELAAESDYFNSDDTYANQALVCYNDFVDEFSDLAPFEDAGRLVLVRGDIGEEADDWWVWWKNGAYEETYGWNAYEIPDSTTMPMILVNNGGGNWDLKETTWGGRTVGDASSNPTPSFIGQKINEMFLYKGRMCMLADENILASQIGEYENFYRTSCQQLLDSDPFDIAAPAGSGAPLKAWIEFDGGLLVSSDFKQFNIKGDGDGLLGPNSVNIKHENSYKFTSSIMPVYLGSNPMFFNDDTGAGWASAHEYQIDNVLGRKVALPITDQVPEYIESGIYSVVGINSKNAVFIASTADRNALWVYQYYFSDQGKVQSAWHKWTSDGDIYGLSSLGNDLYIAQARGGELVITKVVFYENAADVFNNRSVLLDFKEYYDGSQSAFPQVQVSGEWYQKIAWSTTPEVGDEDIAVLVIAPENTGSETKGRIIPVEFFIGTDAYVPLEPSLTGEQFYSGYLYDFSWTLNPIYMRDQNLVAIQDGRLQLRKLKIRFNNSGPFTLSATPKYRDTVYKTYSGTNIGEDLLATADTNDGIISILSGGKSEEVVHQVTSTTPWRTRFSSVEWAGSYRPKRKRT